MKTTTGFMATIATTAERRADETAKTIGTHGVAEPQHDRRRLQIRVQVHQTQPADRTAKVGATTAAKGVATAMTVLRRPAAAKAVITAVVVDIDHTAETPTKE